MRFREVFRYELGHRLRSPSTWIYAVFLFFIMFWGLAATGGEGAANINAPREIAEGIVLFGGTFGIMVSAALFADAALRDLAAGMDPLLYTTRLTKSEYLGGRFLATLLVNAILVLVLPLAHVIATWTPMFEAEDLGAFRFAAYVQPLVIFTLPNLVIIGAVLFTIAALARHVIPVYLGAIGMFIGYIVAANYWSGIENPILSALADPFGINAVLEMSRYWTTSEANVRLIGLPATVAGNRVLWLAIAAGTLVLLHRTFRFAHADGGRSRRKGRQASVETPLPRSSPVVVPHAAGVFGFRTRMRQTLGVARQSLAEVMSARAFQVAFIGSIGLVLLWGWNVGDTVFETSTWPVTHLVISTVLGQRAAVIPVLLTAVYAGELVWKDREVGVAEIADAVPVPTGVAVLGRFLALVAIILVFHAASTVGGMLIQGLQGYYNFELGLYLRAVFGLNLAGFVLLGALAMMIHVLVNQKYVGHIVVLGAYALGKLASPVGLSYLAVYNSGPSWTYSDMNGFGPFLRPFLWFKLYWAAWALLLGVVAVMFWIRGREPGVRTRITAARARLRGPLARIAAAATVLIVAVGGFIFYNTNILNASPSRNEAGRPRAEYERRYGRFEGSPQPVIMAADLRVELYPDEPAAGMRGSYRLVNGTGVAIDSVHVVLDRDIDARSISFDRTARAAVVDEETGYRIFALERALTPGDSLQMSFDVAYRPRGFRSKGIQTDVVANGAYIDRMWLPFIGYQPAFELADDTDRKRFGLGPATPMPGPDDAEATRQNDRIRNEDLVHAEIVVGTVADQIAVVSGTLRRSWTENGRRYFHYGTDLPTAFGASIISARYAVHEDQWKDVALRILHHPTHRYNLDPMVRGMKASLDYYTKAFGPYQYRELRVVELPPYGVRGRALATTILFAEDFLITRAREGTFDQAFFGTAHEVAHSWWGGQLRGAYVRGGAVLSEALSNYSAMMVTEKTFGPEAVRQVYDYQMDRYLSRRASFPTDMPLVVAEHPHIFYGKGAVAMYTMRDHLGDEAVNATLRRFLEKYRDSGPPYSTTPGLVAELRAVTPDSLRYLLTDFFETVTLWDVKAEQAVVERTATGEYTMTLDVVAKKVRADSVGRETEVPMNDLVEIGVFAPGVEDYRRGEPLSRQRHRIRSGRQTISITVPQEPARAGIDPWRKLIDRDRENNVVDVKAISAVVRSP